MIDARRAVRTVTARAEQPQRIRHPLAAFASRAGGTAASTAAAGVLLVAVWAAAAAMAPDLPGPLATWPTLARMVSDPFYDYGPNDKGIGIQLGASLVRVLAGFALGTVVAVPLGVMLGSSPVARRVVDPIVQVLRPVSPLAWFPIGLVVFQSAGDAVVFIIAITSLWPTVINTAFGVASIPESHRNVARVFQFSRGKYLRRVIVPYSLPHTLTGMRLSMGVAWMVIVAGEMLSGGSGIGFFVWDSWNALNLEQVLSAILLIGAVGLALDRGFAHLIGRAAYRD